MEVSQNMNLKMIDKSIKFFGINIAILTISNSRTEKTDKSGNTLKKLIDNSGHSIIEKNIVNQMSDAGFAIGLVDPESTLIDSEKRNLPTLLRMAPHYYNTVDEIEKAVKQLSLLL